MIMIGDGKKEIKRFREVDKLKWICNVRLENLLDDYFIGG